MRRGNPMRSQGASSWPSPLSSCSLRPCPQVPLRQPNLVDSSRLHFRFMEAMALQSSVEALPQQIQVSASKGVLCVTPVSEKVICAPAPASTSRTEIHADLGAIGSIAMQFHPSGEREFKTYKPIGCKRYKVSRKIGTFVGSLRIVGEGEFTTAKGAEVGGCGGTTRSTSCAGVPLKVLGTSITSSPLILLCPGSRP